MLNKFQLALLSNVKGNITGFVQLKFESSLRFMKGDSTHQHPKTGWAGLKAHFKDDLAAGFSVSLIALPLCLGIAFASGVPPIAGLITAIVGGMIASRFGGTFVTINGPAAGLIVITLGAAESLGGAGVETGFAGYPHALGTILIGGAFVALFGLLKVGKVGDYFPPAAVHGMLAAIGVIIIIKQLFPALGVTSPKGSILGVATAIPAAFLELHPLTFGITLIALTILIVHPFIKWKPFRMIPGPLWVLLITVPLVQFIDSEGVQMVDMPSRLFGEGGLQWPSFDKIGEIAFWSAVVSVALVSGIETVLSAKAVDSLDPYERTSNLDKDLFSNGLGSSLAAVIGGLPMISEIVRSSANVSNGAKTQWANFFHGSFLLIYVLIGTTIIEMIPIAALSAILVFTGFRLASPKEFLKMYQIGFLQLSIFIITLIAVLATDLIIGIATGIISKYVILLIKRVPFVSFFKLSVIENNENSTTRLTLSKALIFSNYLSLKSRMDKALKSADTLIVDVKNASYIDHTVVVHLMRYSMIAEKQGKQVMIENMNRLKPVSNHPLAARSKIS